MNSNVVERFIIALFSGIYVAAQPRLYRDGFCAALPSEMHAQVIAKFEAVAQALRLWLIGQLIQAEKRRFIKSKVQVCKPFRDGIRQRLFISVEGVTFQAWRLSIGKKDEVDLRRQ